MEQTQKRFLDYFENTVRTCWNAPALNDFDSPTTFTYGQVAEQIARIHLLFERVGIQKGDKIALCGRNSSMWAISFLAITTYGAVSVAILAEFDKASIHTLANHSDAKLLLVGPLVWTQIDANEMQNLKAILCIEDMKLLHTNDTTFAENYEKWSADFEAKYPNGFTINDVHYERHDPSDPMLINYTSGSTGTPKGVVLPWRSIDSNIQFSQENIPNSPADTLLSMLPMAHMFGLVIEVLYQLAGGTHITVLNKVPSPVVLMKALSEVKPYMLLTVPLVIEKIFKAKIFPVIHKPIMRVLWFMPGTRKIMRRKVYEQLMAAFGGNLRYLIIGGAALNREVETCLKNIHFPFSVGYGMTECGPLISYTEWHSFKKRTCGQAVDRVEIRIDSENQQKNVGEIQVRGDNLMTGYYKNDEATKAIFTPDGWMRTGDLGLLDKQENLIIRGRSKNMILGASGQNIYPEEIEDKLNNLPYIIESVVVARENGKLTALVFADTERLKREFPDLTIEQVMEENRLMLNRLVPVYCRLNAIELVDREFEKTPKRSIKRYMYK